MPEAGGSQKLPASPSRIIPENCHQTKQEHRYQFGSVWERAMNDALFDAPTVIRDKGALGAPMQTRQDVVPAQSDAASLMAVISRAASDPATDVDKLERLLGMYERINARSAEQSYHEAMSDAQAEMRPIAADASNPQTKSKYASFVALDRALRPIYTRYGFSLSYDTDDGAPTDHVRVVCKVSHRAGHTERPRIDMPADGKGAKGGDVMTKTHATGAAMTYGQRYLLKMIFNIAVGDDDDGNGAGNGNSASGVISEAQRDALSILADNVKADKRRFCEWLGVESFADILARDYKKAERALQDLPAQRERRARAGA